MPEREWDNQSKKVVFPREKWFQECMLSLFSKRQYLCGVFALFFGVIAVVAGLFSTVQSFDHNNRASLLNGDHASAFEKRLDDNMAHHNVSRQLWAAFSYVFFKEGRDGVVIGDDGWLFTTEEFDYPKGFQENISKNLSYIDTVFDELSRQDINLLVVGLPSKAETLSSELGAYSVPSYRQGLSKRFENLQAPHIIIEGSDGFFLKTDTHWSPKGAENVAKIIAEKHLLNQYNFSYTIESKGVKEHEGDLMRYTVSGFGIKPDQLPVVEGYGQSNDLFGDANIPVVLVGTSYSANTKWGFEHYLKKYLQADVLNMADEGLGPFEVMKSYLTSNEYESNKPELVIWEIPVRYLPIKFERKSDD